MRNQFVCYGGFVCVCVCCCECLQPTPSLGHTCDAIVSGFVCAWGGECVMNFDVGAVGERGTGFEEENGQY